MKIRQILFTGFVTGVLAGLMITPGRLEAAGERPEETVEIPGEEEMELEEELEVRPIEEIREEKEGIPEIPRPVKETGLSTAEKVRLDELERKHTTGTITQTEHDLEKDSLLRDANVQV